MKRAAIAFALALATAPASAQSVDIAGRWRNSSGQELEFKPTGELVMVGIGTATYQICGQNRTEICVAHGQFQCRYRASYNDANKTLGLATGRPTKTCPTGIFTRQPTSG